VSDGRSDRATAGREPLRSYHGQPVIKKPVWAWEIPVYFFTGGMAGASAGLALGAELRGNRTLARRSWAIALSSVSLSPALLISDLGRPERFLNMLRMFKVTSPMSVGSWVLSVSGTSTGLAATTAWTGLFPRAGRIAKPVAAASGLPLATYTAALIGNTAVPVWHAAHRELPFVFAAGAALSAAAAAVVVTPPDAARPARRLALIGAVAELGAEEVMERRLGALASPYQAGVPRVSKRVSQMAITTGAGLLAARGGRSRPAAALAGGLLCAGAMATRWSVFKAGSASAGDPEQTVGPQRDRIARGEGRGAIRRDPRRQ
jgi:Polysulphide reductase, NrfD